MKLYFNVIKSVLFAVENNELIEATQIGRCTEEVLRDYCIKAYGINKFTNINSLVDIEGLNI